MYVYVYVFVYVSIPSVVVMGFTALQHSDLRIPRLHGAGGSWK